MQLGYPARSWCNPKRSTTWRPLSQQERPASTLEPLIKFPKPHAIPNPVSVKRLGRTLLAMSLPSAKRGSFTVRQSTSPQDREAQLELRYKVLREPLGMTRAQATFARDDDPDTIHLLAVVETRVESDDLAHDGRNGKASVVIGTATMISHGSDVVQLRGMASDPEWAGYGVGRAVLEAAHTLAGSRSLWCDARMSAHDFYARFGWAAEGEIFDIPQVGPHTVMRYRTERG